MTSGNLSGVGNLSIAGKRSTAISWYQKGKSFVGAALLLRRHGGEDSVVLHLLCQGIEVILKALLLHSDYDQFQPQMREPLGHNLVLLVETAMDHFGFANLDKEKVKELDQLNTFYSQHLLRYGSVVDLLIAPQTIPYQRVLAGVRTVVKLGDRYITRNSAVFPLLT